MNDMKNTFDYGISIVIPTHSRPTALKRLLDSLLFQKLARSRFEVLVVSNYEDPLAHELVDAYACQNLPVRILVSGGLGANRARNFGLAEARFPIVLFLDDDCRLIREDHLTEVLDRHSMNPEIALRGGPYVDTSDANAVANAYNSVANAWLLGGSGIQLGGNLSVRKSALRGDSFDGHVIYGGTEVGLQRRLLKAGHQSVVDTDLPVLHDFQGNVLTLIRKAWLQGRAKAGGPSSLRKTGRSWTRQRRSLDVVAIGAWYGMIAQLGAMSSLVSSDRQRAF